MVVADEPDRPRRRVGGPQRRRQQFLVRRLIGVGVGLAFLILIVIGIRGCLQARSDRALRNYDSSVATIMQQSEQSGKDFFQLLSSPEQLELGRRAEPGPRAAGRLLQPARPCPEPERPGPDGRRAGGRGADADPAPQRAHRDRLERDPGRGSHPDRGRDHHDLQRDGIPLRQRHPLDADRQARHPEGPEGRGRRRTAAAAGQLHAGQRHRLPQPDHPGHQAERDHRDHADAAAGPMACSSTRPRSAGPSSPPTRRRTFRATPRRSTSG